MSKTISRPDSAATDHSAASDASAGARVEGTVEVFDPAMCCATGVCGPGVDPALLRIARDLRWIAAQGARVVRLGLSQEPQAFVANARVSGLMAAFGDGALPAVLVNDTVLAHGRYPTREELVAALTPVPKVVDPSPAGSSVPTPLARRGSLTVVSSDEGCCTPESGCC